MTKRTALFLLLLCSTIYQSNAQRGGRYIYEFLNLHPSARVAALGGVLITARDNDPNVGLQNPALLNKEMHNHATFNTVNYFSDINSGYAAYTRHYDSVGTFSAGLQYINYGTFEGALPNGQRTGTFSAGEYNFTVGFGRPYNDRLSYGGAVKFIYSTLEQYTSTGLALDLGGFYSSEDKLITAALVVKNMGAQLTTYTEGNQEPIPFEIQAGFSKKFAHNPLRLSIIAHNLQQPDLTYTNSNTSNQRIDLETGEVIEENISFTDKVMRHVILGGEFLFSKNFNVRFGYNHLRRKELTIEGKRGLVGYSWGFGIKISKFHVSYASSSFHVGNNTNHFSVVSNLSDFMRKGKKSSRTKTKTRQSIQ